MASIRSVSVLLMLGVAFNLAFSCSVRAQDETTMTGAQYFRELKEGGGVPKWATNVCFARVFEATPGKPVDASDSSEFVLMGDDGPNVKFQLYTRGLGENVLIAAREFHDESTSRFAGRLVVEGETNHFQFSINWNTGRFSLSDIRGIKWGVCRAVE